MAVQWGVETQACGEGTLPSPSGAGSAEEIGLSPFPQTGLGEFFDSLYLITSARANAIVLEGRAHLTPIGVLVPSIVCA